MFFYYDGEHYTVPDKWLEEHKKKIKEEVVEKCCNAFKELAVEWFCQSSMKLGDIPKLEEELKEQV